MSLNQKYKEIHYDLKNVLEAWQIFQLNKDTIELDVKTKFIINNIENIIITSLNNFDTSLYLEFFVPNFEEIRDEFLISSEFFDDLIILLIDKYDSFAEDILKSEFYKSLAHPSINGLNIFKYAFLNSRLEICDLLPNIEFYLVKSLMQNAINEDSIVKVKCLLSLSNVSPIYIVNYGIVALEKRKINVLKYISSIIGSDELTDIRDNFYDIVCEEYKKEGKPLNSNERIEMLNTIKYLSNIIPLFLKQGIDMFKY
jgi:hypothetical protein